MHNITTPYRAATNNHHGSGIGGAPAVQLSRGSIAPSWISHSLFAYALADNAPSLLNNARARIATDIGIIALSKPAVIINMLMCRVAALLRQLSRVIISLAPRALSPPGVTSPLNVALNA